MAMPQRIYHKHPAAPAAGVPRWLMVTVLTIAAVTVGAIVTMVALPTIIGSL